MVCTLNQPIWFVWSKGEENLMSIKTRKIGIIGAGNVGSHLALQFAVQGLADEVVSMISIMTRQQANLWICLMP